MAAHGYATDIRAIIEFVPQFAKESDIYQSYSINNPVTKLLKVIYVNFLDDVHHPSF
jgi:hypothetical protein